MTKKEKRKHAIPSSDMQDVISYLDRQSSKKRTGKAPRNAKKRSDLLPSSFNRPKKFKHKAGYHTNTESTRASRPQSVIAEITGFDSLGDLVARPIEQENATVFSKITIVKDRLKPPAGIGDIVQVRLTQTTHHTYTGEITNRASVAQNQVLGIFADGFIFSLSRRLKWRFRLINPTAEKVTNGDFVLANIPSSSSADPKAIFVRKSGSISDAFAPTEMAIAAHRLHVPFSDTIKSAVQQLSIPTASNERVNLTHIPFVTIDGETAKDFDDAVWAQPDTSPTNAGGWHIMVGIADVAWYVRPDSDLDTEARLRGNSVYFPDRVIPMLPFELSNGVCSLKPHENRAALVLEAWIDKDGYKLKHTFKRALIQSQHRLTYTTVQSVLDGATEIAPLMPVLTALNGTFQSLLKQRSARGVLELNVPEYEILLDDKGHVTKIQPRLQSASMKLIEELMILANVAAAETLEDKKSPVMYRVHERPPADKIDALNTFFKTLHQKTHISSGNDAADYNAILARYADQADSFAVNEAILRTQSQARYSPDNEGHFGLSLMRYAHFTSPIRRYADILVHRALIRALKLGPDGLTDSEEANLPDTADHISNTERQAAAAEQDAADRYIAAYLKDRVGEHFTGRISALTPSGIFIRLDTLGTDGFIPYRLLTDDIYDYDESTRQIIGRSSGHRFSAGQTLPVILKESIPLTGSLIFAPLYGHLNVQPRQKGKSHHRAQKHTSKKSIPHRRHRKT